jgi:AraC-like DNA-binding protein
LLFNPRGKVSGPQSNRLTGCQRLVIHRHAEVQRVGISHHRACVAHSAQVTLDHRGQAYTFGSGDFDGPVVRRGQCNIGQRGGHIVCGDRLHQSRWQTYRLTFGTDVRNRHQKLEEKTGRTPAKAVEVFRLEAARRLLEDSTRNIDKIATQCGLGDEEHMRVTFQRNLGVAPRDYRKRFSASGPSTPA